MRRAREGRRPDQFAVREETGAVAVEYGFLAGLIAVVIIVGATLVGERILEVLNSVLAWL